MPSEDAAQTQAQPKKKRSDSSFMVLKEIEAADGDAAQHFVCVCKATTLRKVWAEAEKIEAEGKLMAVCIRSKKAGGMLYQMKTVR